jgi:predicted RNA-binding protein with PUA-like domain
MSPVQAEFGRILTQRRLAISGICWHIKVICQIEFACNEAKGEEVAYWLMKSEPDAYSIDDLARDGTEPWDGIRNYQARNMMRDDMKIGDDVFFYHSSCKEPAVVGLGKVASAPYPDPTQFDPESRYFDEKSSTENPRWILVDISFVRKTARAITLKELKQHPALVDFRLNQRGNRLSIFPVEENHWNFILSLE